MPSSSVSAALGTRIKSPTRHRIRGQHFLESVVRILAFTFYYGGVSFET